MQTTEIKYAIMDRVTGKLLTYYNLIDSYGEIQVRLGSHAYDKVWYINDIYGAYYVLSNTSDSTNNSDEVPRHMINISPASHCVVKVTMVCHVEIVE